jgi:hypothetical protein
VSGPYAASSGSEGGKFLGERVYWLSASVPINDHPDQAASNTRTMKHKIRTKTKHTKKSHQRLGCLSVVCVVLPDRCLCDELITSPEESYRLRHLGMCDRETS